MSDETRVLLDLAVQGLMAEVQNIEAHADELTMEDRSEIRMAMARLNSALSERKAA